MEELISALTQTFTELNRRINESRIQRNQQASQLLEQNSNDLNRLIVSGPQEVSYQRPASASQVLPMSEDAQAQ